eukprot:3952256-Ditylum_brightwellii.AAC.1
MSYIDEHCIVFDSGEENSFATTEIHNEFKEVVEGVLCRQLAEMGVGEDEFYSICFEADCLVNGFNR